MWAVLIDDILMGIFHGEGGAMFHGEKWANDRLSKIVIQQWEGGHYIKTKLFDHTFKKWDQISNPKPRLQP